MTQYLIVKCKSCKTRWERDAHLFIASKKSLFNVTFPTFQDLVLKRKLEGSEGEIRLQMVVQRRRVPELSDALHYYNGQNAISQDLHTILRMFYCLRIRTFSVVTTEKANLDKINQIGAIRFKKTLVREQFHSVESVQ